MAIEVEQRLRTGVFPHADSNPDCACGILKRNGIAKTVAGVQIVVDDQGAPARAVIVAVGGHYFAVVRHEGPQIAIGAVQESRGISIHRTHAGHRHIVQRLPGLPRGIVSEFLQAAGRGAGNENI